MDEHLERILCKVFQRSIKVIFNLNKNVKIKSGKKAPPGLGLTISMKFVIRVFLGAKNRSV